MLQIGEIASLLGITSKTIRHYHQLGLLDAPTLIMITGYMAWRSLNA